MKGGAAMETTKFRIYPNKTQRILLAKTFGCTRLVYNLLLEKRSTAWSEEGVTLSTYDCAKLIPLFKKDPKFAFLKEVDSIALQSSNEALGNAYQRFFRKLGGFPNFKKKNAKQSYTTKNVGDSIKVENNLIRLPKLGFIRFAKSREIRGNIKTVTVSFTVTGKYYISITTDYELTQSEKWKKKSKAVGIDLGLESYVTFSDGSKIDNPRFFKKGQKRLAFEQRKLARMRTVAKKNNRKLEDCSNYQKQKIKVAKAYEKVTNQRKDFLHKLSTDIVKNHDIICMESLKVKNMVKNRFLAKTISDASWGMFTDMVKYKSTRHGRTFKQVNQFFPSSQKCSNCGEIDGPKPLSVRIWTCKNCGAEHDRDVNAAINILVEATKYK